MSSWTLSLLGRPFLEACETFELCWAIHSASEFLLHEDPPRKAQWFQVCLFIRPQVVFDEAKICREDGGYGRHAARAQDPGPAAAEPTRAKAHWFIGS